MRGAGDGPVVLLRAEPDRYGAAQPRPAPRPARPPPGRTSSCGVTAHGRPSKSAALAASGPERSLPAIGCPPTYRSTPGTAGDRRQRPGLHAADVGDDRVGSRAAPRRSPSPRWSGGTATTTSCGRSAGGARPAGTQPGRGAQVLGRRVAQQHLEPGPAAGQPDRGAEQPGADDLDRAGEPAHSSSGTARTRVRSRRSAAAPCR